MSKVRHEGRPLIKDHALIGRAAKIPCTDPSPVISVSPVTLPAPKRLVDLHLRVSFPPTQDGLPIILLSHGHGQSNHLSSMNGYEPLVNFWAAHGFCVIQPTHLSSKSLSLDPTTPGAPLYWRSRCEDMSFIIDHLDQMEDSVPLIKGRLDRGKIAVAGHSLGGHTANLLLGACVKDPENGSEVSLFDPRIKAGIILAAPGRGDGGAALSTMANERYKILRDTDFATMKTPALVVNGDQDHSEHLTVMGAQWHADPYTFSPSPKALLTLKDGKHGLGGISGYDVAETGNDESVERVAIVQRVTWAYLRKALCDENVLWNDACKGLKELGGDNLAVIEQK